MSNSNVGLVKLPPEVEDDEAILLSDIFPTAYMGAENAEIKPGNAVAVFGCGPPWPVRYLSRETLRCGAFLPWTPFPSRLDLARAQGAEVIHFEQEDPIEALKELAGGIGADRVIDAVGIDANRPHRGARF